MGTKILFVDDDPNIQKMVEIFLRNKNYEITFAINGRSALKIFNTGSFDLIITDIQMPVMDGLTLAKEVRKKDKNIPIIVVSAFGQESMSKKMRQQNAFVLNKPFERQLLIAAIEKGIKL